MTKAEAYALMEQGKKVRHQNYSSDEWVMLNKNRQIQTEDGYTHGGRLSEFWATIQKWEDGWEEVK